MRWVLYDISNLIGVFQGLPKALANLNLDTLILTGATIAIIYTFPKITKLIPSPLVALLLVSGINAWVNLNVPLIGDIPKEFLEIRLAEWTLSGMALGLLIKLVRFLTIKESLSPIGV